MLSAVFYLFILNLFVHWIKLVIDLKLQLRLLLAIASIVISKTKGPYPVLKNIVRDVTFLEKLYVGSR